MKGRGQRLLARLARSVSREELRSHPDVREYLEFGDPEHLSLPAQTAVETSNPQWLRDNLALWKPSWPAPFVCVVRNARVLGSLYLGITSRGEVILETTRDRRVSRRNSSPNVSKHDAASLFSTLEAPV
jgi:hypothetical protein